MKFKPTISFENGRWWCTGVCRCGHHTATEFGGNPFHAWSQYRLLSAQCGRSEPGTYLVDNPIRVIRIHTSGNLQAVPK